MEEISSSLTLKTTVSTPSSSNSGCISGQDDDSPGERGWLCYIPQSIVDGQSRFGFIEVALAEASEQQLIEAEEKCKSLVLDSPECSEERRWLVRQLVELRLRIQEKKDDDSGGSRAVVRLVLGHHMELQESGSANSKLQCDRCCGAIWGMVHSWYLCRDCEFVCHARCLSQITRVCVHVAVSERPQFELRICPEVGLSAAQNFRCAECKNHITFTFPKGLSCFGRPFTSEHSWVEPRLCDYSGHYFCPNCHWNTSAVIPARVVHNWDFEPRRISRAARQLLKLMMNKPVLLLKEINPQLFALVEELSLVQALREELLLMKRYLVECKSAGEQRLLWLLRSRQHFVESANLYSLQDLIDINTGELLPFISKVHEIYLSHIKEECKLCVGRGYLCELCDDSKVIFPFDSAALSCEVCSNVFHRSCWAKRSPQHCPRCIRLSERAARLSMNLDEYDSENTAND